MNEFVYCMEHEEMVKLEQKNCLGHVFEAYSEYEIGFSSLEFCCLESGYAYCPPPPSLFSESCWTGELDDRKLEEWEDWCEENQPSDDETLIYDINAIELREDFENGSRNF